MELYDRMINELQRTWKETAVILFRHLHGEIQKNKKTRSRMAEN